MKYVRAIRRRPGGGPAATVGTSLRAGGIRRRLLLLVILLVATVAMLPTIVAKTSLRNSVIASALPTDQLRVTIGGASLGWFSAPSATTIEVKDAAGETLLTVDSVRLDRSLWSLIAKPRELGVIEIVRPTLQVAVRSDGSNVEDAIAQLLAAIEQNRADEPPDDDAAKATSVALRIVEGTVVANDAASGRQWRLHDVNLQYDSHGADGGLGQVSLSGRLADDGRFAFALAPAGDGSDRSGKHSLTCQFDAVSLAAAEPWVRRVVAGAELSGALSGQGTAAWSVDANGFAGDLTTSGMLTIDRLDATAPALSGDRVRLARVELPWRVTARPAGLLPPGLVIEELQVRSDVARLAARGVVDPQALARLGTSAAAAGNDVELRGTLDLPRLAAMLPHALRIRSDTTITSGTVEVTARQQPAVRGQLFSGSIKTARLGATSAGRPLNWDAPMSATFAVHRTDGGLRLDSLNCTSDFLTIDASGTPDQLSASARFDLNRLAEQLGQFIDLSGVELAGTGAARADWKLTGDQQFTASASGDLAQVRVALADGAVWAEPQLAFRSAATGAINRATRQLARVETARLEVVGQGDKLDAWLAGPVVVAAAGSPEARPQPPTTWPVAMRASGSVARWLHRVRPWVDLGTWQIDGQSELTANLRVADRAIDASNTKLVVTDLRAVGPDWSIGEPRLELAGDARWNAATGEVAADSARLVTSTVSLAVQGVRLGADAQGGRQLTGAAAFRTDLARLAAWRAAANPSPAYKPSGSLTGNMRFSKQRDRITCDLVITGEQLAFSGPPPASQGVPTPGTSNNKVLWQEPKLTLHTTAVYDSSSDRLALEGMQVESNTLTATAGGQIENLSTAAAVNLTGTLNYDLAQVTPLLRPYVGKGVQLTGREQARFTIASRPRDGQTSIAASPASLPLDSGSATLDSLHWSRRMQARVELPWSGANVYGLPIGGGQIIATLEGGAVRVDPLTLAVSQGRLTAAPLVRIDPPPAELTLPAGPLISDVRISPEVSEALLKYIAPVLAGATQSEGLFSMQLDGARVPLGDARRADVGGQLTVHSVRVVPGPLANEWITLARQIEALVKKQDPAALAQRPPVTLLSIRDQPVKFRVYEGRVYHYGMDFQVDDVALHSSGWVGFDESLALMLTVPIPDRWIASEPLLAGLKGQSLQIPITGTLTRPRMDQSAIANLSAQLLQSAAGQTIQNELNRALDKLFKPK